MSELRFAWRSTMDTQRVLPRSARAQTEGLSPIPVADDNKVEYLQNSLRLGMKNEIQFPCQAQLKLPQKRF